MSETVSPVPKHSYGQILRSSATIGGASVVNVAIGIVRTKAMALLLGPAGIGLLGLYILIADLTRCVAGVGVNSSGVRQIAEAAGSGDAGRIARSVAVLRRTSVVLGVLGAILLVGLAEQVSTLTFGDEQHAGAVALLSLAVLFQIAADGRAALIQGMRRISELAKMGMAAALWGTISSVSIVYCLGKDGVAPSLVAFAGVALVISWMYSRSVRIERPAMTVRELTQEAGGLLRLGFAFMASGLLMLVASYVARLLVVRHVGLDAAGLYQAAWTLGGLYIGFVLQAMGADFYPRLVAAVRNDTAGNRLVNEQAYISLLLAGPGVIATVTFASLVLAVFYSPEFAGAADVLRWICLGMALRVVSWPMGFIIVAKNRQVTFFCTELVWTLVNVGLTWVCVRTFGLAGAGIAFFGSYVFHALMVYPIVQRLSGFRFSCENRRAVVFFVASITAAFCGFHLLPTLPAIAVGAALSVISAARSIRILRSLVVPSGVSSWSAGRSWLRSRRGS